MPDEPAVFRPGVLHLENPFVAQLELEEGASEISYDEDEDQFSLDSDLDDEFDEEDEPE